VAPLRRREDGEAPALALDPVAVPQTPLELALAQLEHPSADADPESTRRALELVAQELSQREQTDLQTGAQRLAWSAGAPESEAARELAARARHALERGDGADG
jgi:hypothetical protein